MKHPKISIVTATYNERENIQRLVPAIAKQLESTHKGRYEIIIVDDNSPDGTANAIRRMRKYYPVKLYVRKHIRGLGSAVRLGMSRASGDIILRMDADGNHDPVVFPRLLEKLKDADLVVASRFVQGGSMPSSFRYWSSRMVNIMLRVGFGLPIWDNTSGYYAVRASKLPIIAPGWIYEGYGEYHMRMVYLTQKHNLRIKEIPVQYGLRLYGQSKSRAMHMLLTYIMTAHSLHQKR